ncbi:Outer membrane protein OmpA [Geodermatophilus siccatus]|uniref:Outer membrane protein OmpA n=1 Tax=Geodermatophilus siccatus TaxID=1137991 RepID=A0A1G9R450_9ACTN|nr:OmpA family protein [Geodermatophilus siccatus]SDM18024.1 Outer membrane protein OmpA [Geodermatophilus siccatus]
MSGRLLAATASLGLVVGLAGCGGEDPAADPTGAAAFVVGARGNMPAPRPAGLAVEVLDRAVENQSLAAIVVADGEPSVLGTRPLLVQGATSQAREATKNDNRQAVLDGIAGARADDEEADLLGGLDLAARTIRSVETLPHEIAVIDSGLSTVAPLDFTQPGLLEADPEELAGSLARVGELPDLEGMEVVFQGLGDTAPPQEALSIAQRANLVAIWRAVVEAAGGVMALEERPLAEDTAVDLPEVSIVPVPNGPACAGPTIELAGADVAFQPDSAEFVDPAAARAVLQPIAEQLVQAGATATLTGTTARVRELGGQRALSEQRARAVLSELVDLGVPASALRAVGLGSEFPGYVPDHDAAGNLLPGPAAQNRKVIITLENGDTWVLCE